MSLLTLATPLFVELAQQLASPSSRRNPGSQPAKAPGAPSDLPNEGTGIPGTNLGTLFYLISLGVVAAATAVVFFGLAFFLLARPSEGLTVDPSARDRGVEIEPRRPNPAASPGLDATPSTAQTPARSVSSEKMPEALDVLPPASKDTALGSGSAADMGAANATFDGSSSREQPGLRSNVDGATLATPTGVIHAAAHHKRAPRTGSIANQLNHEELAHLQTGSSMPLPAPHGRDVATGPNARPVRGKPLGISWPGAWTFH
jgi:hypothetical protein